MKAMRHVIFAAVVSFFLGFIATLAVLAWLLVRFVVPDARWWEVLHTSINTILISVVLGGLGSAAFAVWALTRYHYWRGFYRCPFCDRRLKGAGVPCDCPDALARR
jgi:hypothetical protein